MQSKQWQRLFIAACINFLVALYMVKDHFSQDTSFCDVSSFISCSKINKSSYASLFGVPVSVWGVLWSGVLVNALIYLYMIAPDASLRERALDMMLFIYLWNIMGSIFVLYLFIAELVIGAICPMCTVIHVTTLFMTLVCRSMYWENKHSTTTLMGAVRGAMVRSRKEAMVVGAVVGVVVVALFLIFHPFALSSLSSSSPSSPSSSQSDTPQMALLPLKDHLKFAACFMRVPKGLHFYGVDGCSHCAEQKMELGDLMSAIVYHECGADCQRENDIAGIPTWMYTDGTGKVHRKVGVLSLQQIYNFVNCDDSW